MTQLHCDITQDDDGTIYATSLERCLTILPDGPGRAFNRNFKTYSPGNVTHERVLVGELDGVRVYILGNDVIMTKQDMYK